MMPRATMKLPDQINVAIMARLIPISFDLLAALVDDSMVCKILFKFSFDPFNRWVKISVFQTREFFVNKFL